jgi:hypothetical protein
MISRTYHQRRETVRFVSRKIPFAFADLGRVDARNATAGYLQIATSLRTDLRKYLKAVRGSLALSPGISCPKAREAGVPKAQCLKERFRRIASCLRGL